MTREWIHGTEDTDTTKALIVIQLMGGDVQEIDATVLEAALASCDTYPPMTIGQLFDGVEHCRGNIRVY